MINLRIDADARLFLLVTSAAAAAAAAATSWLGDSRPPARDFSSLIIRILFVN